MRFLLLVALFGSAFAVRNEMLESNRIPAGTAVQEENTTCDRCKWIIDEMVQAIDDPTKMQELKVLLAALCLQTPFTAECNLFVANIELFLKKLEPYLRDAEKVCKKMHLCANPTLDGFHRFLMSMKTSRVGSFVCDECQMAVIEFKKYIDKPEVRKEVSDWLETECRKIPKYTSECDVLVNSLLPEFWQELDAMLTNPKQACAEIELCSAKGGVKAVKKNKIAAFIKAIFKKH